MNQALTIKTSTDLHPVYTFTEEQLAFLYTFGEVARKTSCNPLLHLEVNKATRRKNVTEMSEFLLNQFHSKLKNDLTHVKELKDLRKIIALSFGLDHMHAPAIKVHMGAFTLNARIMTHSNGHWEIESFDLPIKSFEVGKGDTTDEANSIEIHKILNWMGEHQTSCSITGDGAVVRSSLIKLFDEQAPQMTTILFPCMSHSTFLQGKHTFYLVMDDAEMTSTFFPNHNPKDGKQLFFFGDEQRKQDFCKDLCYWFEILKNLDTPSKRCNIKLADYVVEIQISVLKQEIKKRKKKHYGKDENEKKFKEQIMKLKHDDLSSTDNFAYYIKKYFPEKGDDDDDDIIIDKKVVKINNDPGKKARRMILMCEKLTKVAKYADSCARKYFSDCMKIPQTSFSTKFIRLVFKLTL